MRTLFASICLLTVIPSMAAVAQEGQCLARKPAPAQVESCFTPGENCADQIVDSIDEARKQILVQAMFFSNKAILKALARARSRGVNVSAILSKGSERKRSKNLIFLQDSNIDVLIDSDVKTQHNKTMIIDGEKVITGSYNFTYSAENKNAENLIIITASPCLASRYLENWKARAAASRPVELPPE